MLVNPFTGRQFVAPQHLCQRERKYRNILELRRADFIKILRKQLVFPKKLMNPTHFTPHSLPIDTSAEASSRHQERQCALSKGADPYTHPIQIVYTRTAASTKPVFRGFCDQYWSLVRPVLLRAVTSTAYYW